MTDNQLNAALAAAIGYLPADIKTEGNYIQVRYKYPIIGVTTWRTFDYRDFAVIWPLAAHFDCFPYYLKGIGGWVSHVGVKSTGIADTPARAVALAVIGARA